MRDCTPSTSRFWLLPWSERDKHQADERQADAGDQVAGREDAEFASRPHDSAAVLAMQYAVVASYSRLTHSGEKRGVTNLPCIYCRRAGVPRTKEHVLQAAFGATATLLTAVCGDCNSAFSAIDKIFVDAVHFHYTGQNMARQLGIGRAVLDDGVSVNARYRTDGNGEFLPQLYEATPTTWKYLGHKESEFHAMLRELAEPASLRVSTAVVTADGAPRLAIVRSAPMTYLVQSPDAALAERFAAQVLRGAFKPDWTGEAFSHSNEQNPAITFQTALQLDPFCRAMSKIALNFVCHRLGAEMALQPQFDAVRKYARYGDGHFMDFAVPTLLNHELAAVMDAFIGERHHACYLMTGGAKSSQREAVFIGLRGKTIGRLDLTRGTPGLPQATWLLTRFDEEARSFQDLVLPGQMLEAILNPAVLGLQHLWPR